MIKYKRGRIQSSIKLPEYAIPAGLLCSIEPARLNWICI